MRSMMLAVLVTFLCGTGLAQAGGGAIGNETPTAEQAKDKVESETADEAEAPEEFKIPPGYHAKKRGKKVVYCKKSMESGTRFSQEKCYDEMQLQEMELEREQDQTTFDQSRKICSNLEACGGG
ncbi:MAG: hypothetical protein WD051_10600 [Steroidobacteraceae bacterium]